MEKILQALCLEIQWEAVSWISAGLLGVAYSYLHTMIVNGIQDFKQNCNKTIFVTTAGGSYTFRWGTHNRSNAPEEHVMGWFELCVCQKVGGKLSSPALLLYLCVTKTLSWRWNLATNNKLCNYMYCQVNSYRILFLVGKGNNLSSRKIIRGKATIWIQFHRAPYFSCVLQNTFGWMLGETEL